MSALESFEDEFSRMRDPGAVVRVERLNLREKFRLIEIAATTSDTELKRAALHLLRQADCPPVVI